MYNNLIAVWDWDFPEDYRISKWLHFVWWEITRWPLAMHRMTVRLPIVLYRETKAIQKWGCYNCNNFVFLFRARTSINPIIPRGPAMIPLEFISSSNRMGSIKPSRFAFFSPPSIILAHNPVRTVSYLSLSLSEEKASFNCCWMAAFSLARINELLLLFSCRDDDDEWRENDDDDDDDDGCDTVKVRNGGVTNASAWWCCGKCVTNNNNWSNVQPTEIINDEPVADRRLLLLAVWVIGSKSSIHFNQAPLSSRRGYFPCVESQQYQYYRTWNNSVTERERGEIFLPSFIAVVAVACHWVRFLTDTTLSMLFLHHHPDIIWKTIIII